jgi:hypothetical protein
MKIYVCSSWRNPHYPGVVEHLRSRNLEVWDWRNPPTGGHGFKWQDAGMPDYEHGDKIDAADWHRLISHPVAETGFASDMAGMNWCDVGAILYPCGKSAHMEAGWLAGRGKTVHMVVPEDTEPDLMVKLFNGRMFRHVLELADYLKRK